MVCWADFMFFYLSPWPTRLPSYLPAVREYFITFSPHSWPFKTPPSLPQRHITGAWEHFHHILARRPLPLTRNDLISVVDLQARRKMWAYFWNSELCSYFVDKPGKILMYRVKDNHKFLLWYLTHDENLLWLKWLTFCSSFTFIIRCRSPNFQRGRYARFTKNPVMWTDSTASCTRTLHSMSSLCFEWVRGCVPSESS